MSDNLDRVFEAVLDEIALVLQKKDLRRKCSTKQLWTARITQEEYDLRLNLQDGKCAVCGKGGSGRLGLRRLVIDHNHKTKEVRGLLCSSCNSGLGFLNTIKLLEAGLRYIQERGSDGDD